MLVFDDIGALFATDLHDRAVGLTRVMSTPNSFLQNVSFSAGQQTSMMLIDCGRAKWNSREILLALRKGKLTYKEVMYNLSFMPEHEIYDNIEPTWNSLDSYESGITRLLHFTNVPTQPWRQPGMPLSEVWLEAFRQASREGAIPRAAIERAVAKGDVYADLLDEFDQISSSFDEVDTIDPDIARVLNSFRSSKLLTPYFRLQSILRSLVWKALGASKTGSVSSPEPSVRPSREEKT